MKCDCGHEPSKHESFTSGYGTDKNGKTSCYECCAKGDLETMEKTGRITLYLSKKDNQYEVSNWPGSLKFKAFVKTGRHNFARIRYDAWFWVNNVQWHGVQFGDNTQICHCKRTKNVNK